jgi:dolichol-phosphate mannosyltransferase
MQRRVLVTGGTGFVGANLTRRLVADGHAVHLLVQPRSSRWRLGGLGDVRLHEASIADAAAVASIVRRVRPEWVFHLAAYGAYSWQTDLDRMVATNVLGTMHLVRAALAADVEAFVHAGSSSEYGFKPHAPTEREWLEPNSHYAVTKAAATLFCRHTAMASQVNLTTLRLYSVYGPYEDPRRLLPTLIVHASEGRWPPLVAPEIARDFVHVDDVCDAFILAASRSVERGAVYNVGTGVQTTLREAVAVAQRVLGVRRSPRWGSLPQRRWDTNVWVADCRAIRTALGWTPHVAFEDGFRRMASWLLGNATMLRRYRSALRSAAPFPAACRR